MLKQKHHFLIDLHKKKGFKNYCCGKSKKDQLIP